jgi:hypothetical protein
MKKAIFIIFIVLSLIAVPSSAHAHVLLRDTKTDIGAVLHINPDDDPTAGPVSQLYFDIQDQKASTRIPYTGYQLLITNDQGSTEQVALDASGSNVTANYAFPAQGVYKLELRSSPRYNNFAHVSLVYNLRVSRGVAGRTMQQDDHPWANIALIISASLLLALAIIGLNNRYAILNRSKFK